MKSISGDQISWKTIRYLRDRYEFEYRWLDTLPKLDIPCLLAWGDSDAVAPLSIGETIRNLSRGKCDLHVIKGGGHFVVLEDANVWLREVYDFSKKHNLI